MWLFFIGVWVVVVVIFAGSNAKEDKRRIKEAEERRKLQLTWDKKIFCHCCREKGHVRTQTVKKKKGISGAKATGAMLTGGLSLLATGLSRKEDTTEARCSNCGQVWHY